jgi:hypothetical protein
VDSPILVRIDICGDDVDAELIKEQIISYEELV